MMHSFKLPQVIYKSHFVNSNFAGKSLFAWITETMIDTFYHLEYSDYCLNLYNVSVDASFGRCFFSNLGTHKEDRTEPFTVVDCSYLFNNNLVQIVSCCTCIRDWNCNLKIISLINTSQQLPICVVLCVLLDNSEWIFITYKPDVSICPWDTTQYYYVRIFYLSTYCIFFFIQPFDYWLASRIYLYIWSAQHFTVTDSLRLVSWNYHISVKLSPKKYAELFLRKG